jgi:hypothetical protein
MKWSLNITIPLVAVIILTSCFSGCTDSGDNNNDAKIGKSMLIFQLNSQKSTYEINETIQIEISLISNSSSSLYILPLTAEILQFFVINQTGDKWQYKFSDAEGVSAPRDNKLLEELEPDNTISIEITISSMYDFSKPGNYTVEIVYDATEPGEITKDFWNYVASDTLLLTIKS